jgi:hypothetical protein
MEPIPSPPIAAMPIDVKPQSLEPTWIDVTDRLPDDGETVHVMLERSRNVRVAWRGHYESTGAWFDAETRGPIYEAITRWKPRN